MEVFLVGGAVRDEILGLPIKERDWVVVGTTVTAMLDAGYTAVGKDFPVFLHPETKEEYALARTERKTGHGYAGFQFNTAIDVTLEQDLMRRDLTINAIAKDSHGSFIDPYNGRDDIQHKVLRHVSEAFVEDPLRFLRLARFAATFPDFTIHPDTAKMMHDLVSSNELSFLTAERVWLELKKALATSEPWRFFAIVAEFNAAAILWSDLLPQNYKVVLEKVVALTDDINIRFASICCGQNLVIVDRFIKKYKINKSCADLARLLAKYGTKFLQCYYQPNTILELLYSLDVWRRPQRLADFAIAVLASSDDSSAVASYIAVVERCYKVAADVRVEDCVTTETGSAIAAAIKQHRLKLISTQLSK